MNTRSDYGCHHGRVLVRVPPLIVHVCMLVAPWFVGTVWAGLDCYLAVNATRPAGWLV